MSDSACARCGKSVSADQLIPHEGKRICLECELEVEDDKRMRGSVIRSIASVPIIVGVTPMMLCIPYLNFVLFPGLSVVTMVVSIQAIRLSSSIRSDPEDYGVSEGHGTALLVLGILGVVIGAGYILFSLLLLGGLVMSLFLAPQPTYGGF